MLRNSKMFFWEWREIHLYFHNLPVKQPSYVGGNCKTFHWTSWGVFVQSQRGKKRLFSCQEAVAEIRKKPKKNPKMKCQLFKALLLLFQGHFSVTWLLFSRDNPGIKEKAAFPNRKQRKAGQFPFLFPLFSWLICEHRDSVFSTRWILWN